MPETVNMNSVGVLTIPAKIRRSLGLERGGVLVVQARNGIIELRPTVLLDAAKYSPERQAEFILNNAVDRNDYAAARRRVEGMGLDPDKIPHERPQDASPPARSRRGR